MAIKKIFNWLIGFILSLVIFPNYLVESVIPVVIDNELGIYLPTPGSKVRWRTEGWGTTIFSKYGIAGEKKLTDINCDLIGIWGDSFVEGLHVDNSAKAPQRLTSKLKNTEKELYAIGIGQAGWAITDYYYLIPLYEKLGNFQQHYIIFTTFKDVLPDEYQFFSTPTHKLIHKPREYGFIKVRNFVNKWGLDLPYIIIRKILKDEMNQTTKLRFMVGKANQNTTSKIKSERIINNLEAYNFILGKMKDISDKPITFIYVPNIPVVGKNKIIDELSLRNIENVRLFSNMCEKHGFQFVDLSNTFTQYFYNNAHKMPNGFANSIPGKGHWNVKGHNLVAESIYNLVVDH
jgi:hypothetical protein